MGKLLRKMRRSVLMKVLLVIAVAGMLANILVSAFFRQQFRQQPDSAYHKNLSRYIDYLIADIGIPPDTLRARELSDSLLLEIYYEDRRGRWASSGEFPAPEKIHFRPASDHLREGWYRGRFFILADGGDYRFLLGTGFWQSLQFSESSLVLLILLLSLVFAGALLVVRRIFKPLRWLTEGVAHLSRGDLEHRIPVRRHDELGELAQSFNEMSGRIREMIRAREQLLLDVSHELRSPLTRMKVALEFMPAGSSRESIGDDLAEMESMIAEILETERLNSEHGQLSPETVNIINLLRDTAEHHRHSPPGIDLSALPEEILLRVDPERMRLVFKNIIENALKYSNSSGPAVEITANKQEDAVVIDVRDYGSGIPEAQLPFIFEPFYRVDRSRAKESGGFGLGMSLCKKIIEAHGGNITVDSQLGHGTSVTLTFPISSGVEGSRN